MRSHEHQRPQILAGSLRVLDPVGRALRAPDDLAGAHLEDLLAGGHPAAPGEDVVALVLACVDVDGLRLPRLQDVHVGEEVGRLEEIVLRELVLARLGNAVRVAHAAHRGFLLLQ